ncbi:MAG: pyridoxamine 5'-phosphate oxidase family protein [Candidatus Tectomicrobia bacterium]|nr:pyridoxamine 5'-phosphate oxidase family protein [Candidatus Tectomicrobia bacterium]
MDEQLKQDVLDYLATHNTMTLATVADGGQPMAATVFFANEGFTLFWLSDPKTRHSQNLQREARLAVTVTEDYKDWRKIRGIQMEGRARVVSGLRDHARALRVYLGKFPFVGEFIKPEGSMFKRFAHKLGNIKFYTMEGEQLWFTDNEREFGFKGELLLKPPS